MALLTREDIRHHHWLPWACLAALAGVAAWFWTLDKHRAAVGTLAALVGCLGLILPPRERMPVLPWRLRTLPRLLDAAPVLAAIIVSPGYGLGWFYGANPFDEAVHLLNGGLFGAFMAALLRADGQERDARQLAAVGAAYGLLLGTGWEVFEWATGLIGDWTDTWTDVALTTFGSALGAVLWGLRGPRAAAG